jgi:hypothetical protein
MTCCCTKTHTSPEQETTDIRTDGGAIIYVQHESVLYSAGRASSVTLHPTPNAPEQAQLPSINFETIFFPVPRQHTINNFFLQVETVLGDRKISFGRT